MLVKRKSSSEVRIIVDLREANKAVVREVHPLPTIEQMTYKIGENKVFTKLDVKQAFYQVLLHEDCRYITTFISPLGLMRYKRLMFGLSAAPELFQKVMETIFADMPWLIVFIDDILIPAKDSGELSQRSKLVLERLHHYNVLVNNDKIVSNVEEIDFLGYSISQRGVSVSPKKLEAIQKMQPPRSCAETRSFLGLVNFVHRYVPDMATLTFPLNALTHKESKFVWEAEHQEAFEKIKTILLKHETLGFYNPTDETFIVADASPVGLGAVLVQRKQGEHGRIICYASKTLSPVERKYAQTEREALALVWACERFHDYVYGLSFWLITDHKPLVSIFGDRLRPSPRIERWKLRLMSYDYKVMYRPGNSNIADVLSRLCQNTSAVEKSFDEESERIVKLLAVDACPKSLSLEEIELATKNDIELQELMKWIPYPASRWPKTLSRYKKIASSLTYDGNVLMKDHRIVIPRSLHKQVLQIAHDPHLGISSMKRRLRTKVWWTRMDNMVEQFVQSCSGCMLVSEPNVEPITRTEMPAFPWQKLALDFMEIPGGNHLLVITDYFSRYIEVVNQSAMTASLTIMKLREIFARFGYPEVIVCDNGQPFASEEFSRFCTMNGIKIQHSVPYAAFQNGLVERQNRNLLKTIKISVATGRNWKNDLQDFLHSYRATPHSSTDFSPAELMFGWNIRDRLPPIRRKVDMMKARNNDKYAKEKGKLYTDKKKKAKHSSIDVGDHVLVKNMMKKSKLTTNFASQPHIVLHRNGTRLRLKNLDSGVITDRHINHTKAIVSKNPLLNILPLPNTSTETFQGDKRKPEAEHNLIRSKRLRKNPSRFTDYKLYNLN